MSQKFKEDGRAENETRCKCGQLLLKLLDAGIEIKCKRCKRKKVVTFASIERWNEEQ